MRKTRAAGVAAVLAAALAQAQEPSAFAPPDLSARGVRALAAGCAMCHGTEGRPVPGSTFAPLAGRPAPAFIDAMNAFRDGKREATLMHQIAKGYGDAEIAALAEHFAKLAP